MNKLIEFLIDQIWQWIKITAMFAFIALIIGFIMAIVVGSYIAAYDFTKTLLFGG